MESALPAPPIEVELMTPYDRQEIVAKLYDQADVRFAEPGETGTHLKVRVDERQLVSGTGVRSPASLPPPPPARLSETQRGPRLPGALSVLLLSGDASP